ncbi:MAG TPA: sigma-70 family RNA polymerase sigma factor [Jatrophihabitans sp.]|jgi:RNA polymerase sigma-70 factor (sigma-E family)|uniref:sigma-70 family RNA polymerase sigma factor n=1 Tax=Jatrophihabitans sp. TaxID=1932789 RepID=UPI002DFCC585|nr:sigma-70 family RNA polymerase sigma factor [Jatrophihabitans sp.]
MGPDETLAQLVTTSGDRLLRLAYQLTHDRAAAEDVVQEALMNIHRSWRRRLPEIENVEAYARRAVVNEYLRRKRLHASSEIVTERVPETGRASAEQTIVDRDELWRALGALPARQRAVLVLRYYEDLPDHRIAELVDAKEATVRSLASRALIALRSPRSQLRSTP